jgi:hypothetical protein
MLFLIDYDSRAAEIVELREFSNTDILRARYEQLRRELNLTKRGLLLREVALIEANDLLALKQTHSRYFQTAREQLHNISPEGHVLNSL